MKIKEALTFIANRYDDSKTVQQCAEDAYEMASVAKAALSALEASEPVENQNARFAIDGAITYGRQGINRPPEGHWLMEFWEIGRQLAACHVDRNQVIEECAQVCDALIEKAKADHDPELASGMYDCRDAIRSLKSQPEITKEEGK
ncbi:MAG TPA: hypothetical protein VJ654_14310 [Noviherbaspirillum sp.]|nr:hypothetical protein [Noviherbaspirillum sp.]